MNAKNLLTAALLLLVVAAVVTIVVREAKNESDSTEPTRVAVDSSPPAEGLVAYYLHGETRCLTCRKIEAYAQEAIESGFAEELATGAIEWRVVNYDTPANAHFASEYEIIAPTVILVRTASGQRSDWQNLSRVWELVGDKTEFVDYIQQETDKMLDPTGVETES